MDGTTRARILALVLVLAAVPLPVGADGHVPLQVYETIHVEGHDDDLGRTLAWHGDSIVVGTPQDDVVHVLRLEGGLWRVVQTLEGEQYSGFGEALAVDGDLLVVGAPNEYAERGDGAVHLYQHSGSWRPVDRLTPPDDDSYSFGETVDVDGDWIAVGSPSSLVISSDGTRGGAVHLFKTGPETRHQQTLRLNPLVDQKAFGYDIDLHGSSLVVGAPGWLSGDTLEAGSAHIYVRAGNTWSQQASLGPGPLEDAGGFGVAVALWGDEAIVCDDASLWVEDDDRSVYVYKRSGSTWSIKQTIRDVSCIEVVQDGDRMVTAGQIRPYLRVYGREGSNWKAQPFEPEARPTGLALGGDVVALGYPFSYGGTVRLLGHNVAPEAVAADLEPPMDMDGDGVETVTLDGSGSHGGDGDAVEHFWYRDDDLIGTGATLTVELPVGVHDVRLAVADPMLGTDVAHVPVRVLPPPPPKADFSWLPARATVEETFRFVDESTSEYGHVVAWSWDLDGDGSQDATGPTPSWDFPSSGRHKVTLTVRTDLGTEGSATKQVTVRNLAPDADAGMDQIIHDEDGDGLHLVRLDGSGSEDRDGEVRSYRWVEDGKQLSTSKSPSVLLGLGVHDIDLTVEDDQGARDTDRVTILILEGSSGSGGSSGADDNETSGGSGPTTGASPKAAFNWKPDPGPPTHAAKFTDQSSDPDGRVIMWWYDVDGDGEYEATEPDPVLSMGGYGGRDVRLKVTDDDGQQSETTRNVFLKNEAPTAVIEARATEAFVGQKVVFVDNSTDPENALAMRAWDFGDGSTGAEQAPVHTYAAAGTYTVKLTVTDDGDKTSTDTLKVTVQEVPEGVTVAAVAGSPVVQQAEDSPLADEELLVDTDGDGTPDAPAGAGAGKTGGGADDGAGDFQASTGEAGPGPVATLTDPGKPWLWVGVLGVAALLGAILFAVARR